MDHHPDIFFYLFNSFAVINTQTITVLIFVLVVLFAISFFISGAEVAYFSLGTKEVNVLKTKQQTHYKRIVDLLDQPKILLTSLVVAGTIINVCIIAVLNIVLQELLPPFYNMEWLHPIIKFAIIAVLLLMFSNITPKVMATQNNIRFAKVSGALVAAITFLFEGMARRIVALSDFFEKKWSPRVATAYNLDELENTATSNADETTSQKERNILRGIVKFGDITVKQIMKARLDVSGIAFHTSFADVIKRVEELHYSRLPVFKNDLDEVVGMVHTKDLLPYINLPDYDWHLLIRPPYFIHEQKLIKDLLQEFQTKRTHFAIVVDEFGGTSGIVTLEDIMEEIIGDIRDEFDDDDLSFQKIDDHTYLFDGKVMINDVCKAMGLSLETFDEVRGNSDSLAGLILETTGEIPQQDEVVSWNDFEFTIVAREKNRLQKIKVSIQSPKS